MGGGEHHSCSQGDVSGAMLIMYAIKAELKRGTGWIILLCEVIDIPENVERCLCVMWTVVFRVCWMACMYDGAAGRNSPPCAISVSR